MKVSVIIPMYNESKIIADTAQTLSKYMSQNFEDYEIIFFDDGSVDNSKEAVEALALENVKVLGYEQNQGKGCAVRNAMLAAVGDIRIFTDADLAYGTDVIKNAYTVMCEHPEFDILLGSRNAHKDGYDGYTLKRKIMSKVYIKILCVVGGFKINDSQCGFKAFKADTANDIFTKCKVNGFAFDFEAILRATRLSKSIGEFPVKIINHRDSSVKPLGDAVKMLKDLRKIKKDIRAEERSK